MVDGIDGSKNIHVVRVEVHRTTGERMAATATPRNRASDSRWRMSTSGDRAGVGRDKSNFVFLERTETLSPEKEASTKMEGGGFAGKRTGRGRKASEVRASRIHEVWAGDQGRL
jgi:hypothetical protein